MTQVQALIEKYPKVALVTGASRGIGLSLCQNLALHGWKLIITARNEDRLSLAAHKLEQIKRDSVIHRITAGK